MDITNLSRAELLMLSEALSQYVENNQSMMRWFDPAGTDVQLNTKLAVELLELVDYGVANPHTHP